MKTLAFALCVCVSLLSFLSPASEPSLWAFDVGAMWSPAPPGALSLVVGVDPFGTGAAAFPPGWNYLMDASYDTSNSILYVSGGFSTGPAWWYQNTIGVFSGGPGGLEFVSSSNAGMGGEDGYHWLGGIAHMDGSLYAVGFIGFDEGDVLLRIDDPGTAGQTVTQVGPVFPDIGAPVQPVYRRARVSSVHIPGVLGREHAVSDRSGNRRSHRLAHLPR